MIADSTDMKPREIRPAGRNLDACVTVPGSKSITNRSLLLAALASGESLLAGALSAADTLAFVDGLRSLGFQVDTSDTEWRVQGANGHIPRPEAAVFCNEAGTAARFLLAACATGRGRYLLDAAPQLRRRPLSLLLDALRHLGARTEPADATHLPLTVVAGGLTGGHVRLPGDTSSQFISALLMAAPLATAPLSIDVDGLVSRPYVDMTLAMMAQFGVETDRSGHDSFEIQPGTYRARQYAIEPDASTASYFFAGAAATGGRVKVRGLRRSNCLQGDIRFVDVLATMGCRVCEEGDGVVVTGPATLSGVTVDMSDISDTFMTLAAIAPLANSPVTITGIANVRLKESDRIAAMQDNLARLGVNTEAGADFLRIHPASPGTGHVNTMNDHRIAMSFSVLGLAVPGIVIDAPDCVRKTCPTFFDLWTELESGAKSVGGR
ncbi:MAG: 3-phosphoshikimate 1-carboxyvinyltransferase [Thermoleophilia bacterium]